MKPTATLGLGFVMALAACDRIQDIRIGAERRLYLRREQAFHADMDRISKDTRRTYQLDYVVSDDWLPAFRDTQPKFRATPDGQFDMTPWLRDNGTEVNAIARAVFDPANRKITIIDTGPNIALIETIIEPMRPTRYRAIKTPSSPEP